MNYLFIVIPAILISIVLIYTAIVGAAHIQEEEDPFDIQKDDKFQPRKITDLSKGTLGTDPVVVAPKKKYYKKKKKKPSVNTPVEKKPVGRPKKSE
jgi:hypothetical protein